MKGRATVWERVSWTPLKLLQSKSHSKAAALLGLRCTFQRRVRDWVFCTPDWGFVSCTRVRTAEAPLKLFWIYCYFLWVFSPLNCSSLRANRCVAVFGEGLCLESIAGASGALYLSSAVRAHLHLALFSVNLSSMNYCRRSKMQIYDVNVYVSSL